ncbi:hypothetical protein [Stenotrophobium rhamnosiphilum]|uniref:Uncharacterized protein n=1 Tax=Stenotrophobium rhamnosiphilum TaxID=2029166 RepID=A0A2T5MCN3_9GAMM|nr:hypothetical protein [Stenotrophobium rhamnosiphilum]PTU30325.1 hypothetical protein CJD38_15375 [Stenotrophobium rhamnosiphilum]
MDNPFKKRRTELIADKRTLLSLISPTPVNEFFRSEKSELLEKLTMVVGTPGCGKTTIAQIVEFETLGTLCISQGDQLNDSLMDALTYNGLILNGVPVLMGHRLAMSTNFRGIWDLPYSNQTRSALLRAFVQSKAVLGWFRQLEGMNVSLTDVEIVMGGNADSLAVITGADSPAKFRQYARDIELAIFKIVTALVPPAEGAMAAQFLNTSYDVFEALKYFKIRNWPTQEADAWVNLRPMIIIDDAHELHPAQFLELRDWLKTKTIGVSRWLMCRPDVVAPEDYREAMTREHMYEEGLAPGSTKGRDYLIKLMELGSRDARRFKPIATDIANRYIAGIPEFSRRSIRDIRNTLDVGSATLPDGQIKQLREEISKLARDSRFSDTLVNTIGGRIPSSAREDEKLAALRILLNRERNRTPQLGLLGDDTEIGEPVTDEKMAATSLIDGGRIQLMRQFERPYYYGMDKLIAASNVNIEQFIRLTGSLVDELLARMIRGNSPTLTPRSQHKALINQANQTMNEWDFPYNSSVRILVHNIATRCQEITLRPNAPLTLGANAIGVPQDEMDRVLERSERLTRILHFAFAYKALVFVPQYKCKGKVWCLLELGALPSMAYGLRLSRGGFIEDTLSGLQSLTPEFSQ